MTWEEKTKMIHHFNSEEYEQATQTFIDNIDTVDEQAIEMFFTGIELTKETLSKSIDNHKIIYEKLYLYPKGYIMNIAKFVKHKLKYAKSESFRTAIRMALYEKLISEILNNQTKN